MKMESSDRRDELAAGGSMDERDAFDCLAEMLKKEEHYLCHDYLQHSHDGTPRSDAAAAASGANSRPAGPPIDETCRSKMCEWIFHVVDSTRLRRETASVAMGYLDRFLCTPADRAARARESRREYQLAAMTCLYLAVKLHEPFEMDAGLMSRLSRGIHSAEEIAALEYEIIVALRWRLNGPTPLQFVNYILEMLPEAARPAAPILREHACFQTELAAGDYALVPHLRHSQIAVASILNSLGGLERDGVPFNETVQFVRNISQAFELDIDSPLMEDVRERLLKSFAKSSGYELSAVPVPIGGGAAESTKSDKGDNGFGASPACVLKEMAFSLSDYAA